MKYRSCTDTALVMSDRHGVEIDYCPPCRGQQGNRKKSWLGNIFD